MKTQKLLVLGALCLFGLSANATIVDGVRQKPVPTTQGFTASADTTENYYLYNVSAKQFFAEGNNYGTRGSVADLGQKVAFVQYAGGEEGVYIWNDYSPAKKSWQVAFFNDVEQIYVDRASQANYGWAIENNGATFRIHASDDPTISPDFNWTSYPDMYVGVCYEKDPATALTPVLEVAEGNHVDWAFVTVDNYASYEAALNVYTKAQELLAKIEEAESKGIDTSAAKAAYADESKTLEELQAAIDALQNAINAAIENSASVSNPQDMTSYIANPGFDDGTSTGWSGTAPNMNGDGNHAAALVAEHYNKTFDTYQNLTGLPNGVYKMNASTFFRGTYDDLLTGANKVAYMYAANVDTLRTFFNNAYKPLNTESFVETFGSTTDFGTPNVEGSTTTEDGTVYYIPNNPSTFRLYCEAGYYGTELFFAVNDGKMTIGVKKDKNITGTDWAVFDSFGLTYYGNSAEAYAYWVEQVKANVTDYSEMLVSTWALDAYNNVVNSISFSNNEQAAAAMKTIEEAEAVIAENAALWQQWKKKIAEASAFMADEKYEDYIPDEFDTYINLDVEEIEDARSLTNEEIEAEIAKIDAWMEETKEAAANALQPGDDVTYLLTNPDFTGNANGWTRVAASGGNVAWGSNCYEAWNNSNFDIYQEVKNAPVGVYAISVQGFYRYGRGTTAWNAWNAQDNQYVKESPCYVYLNDIKTPFMNVFAEAITDNSIFGSHTGYNTFDGYYAPNDMATAADCFAADSEVNPGKKMFTQEAFGLISNVGDPLRIGVKGSSNQLGDSWVIFDNFVLTYMGNDFATIKKVLEPELEAAKALEGWMGKSVYEALQKAIADADNAINTSNGDAAFACLKTIVEAVENARTSMALFDELRTALEGLNDVINSGNINDNAKPEAQAFIADTRDDAEDHLIEDSDVPELMNKIAELTTKLQKPKEGSDASPANWTAVIVNPDYINNATTGWTTGATIGYNGDNGYYVAEIFNTTFDYYQDIFGLDEGTYEVKVKGFYRYGGHGPALDYENQNDESKSLAFLYANGGNGQSSTPLTRLTTEVYYTSGDGLSQLSETEMYVPNTLAAAGMAMVADGMYANNSVIVKVNADGKLRIGLKKTEAVENDWTAFTLWELWSYGKNSSKQATGDAMGIDELMAAPAMRVEFFTVDGRRASAAQKGILIQKNTLQNGTVVVRKVRK